MDGKALTPAEVQALATLPSREVIFSQLLGVLNAPATQLVRLLNEPGSYLARVIDAIGKRMARSSVCGSGSGFIGTCARSAGSSGDSGCSG